MSAIAIVPYFDAHCDTLSRCTAAGESLWENSGQLDLRRLSAYAPVGQVFALYTDSKGRTAGDCLAQITAQAALFAGAKERWGDLMQHCRLSLEGAELIGCDGRRLPLLKEWGVCWVNLTWNHANALAGPHGTDVGLTAQGRAFVRDAEALGMRIDVSHLSDRGFWDLCEVAERPLIASHSNSRALCPVSRNLTDEMASAIIRSGGYIGINFYTCFLGEQPDMDTVAAHMEHFLALGAENHLGLGSDFDGADMPADLPGVQAAEALWEHLLRRNYSEDLLYKLFYKNLFDILL